MKSNALSRLLLLLASCLLFSEARRLNEPSQWEQQQQQQQVNLQMTNITMCNHIDSLPEECSCTEKPPLGLVINCLKHFNSTFFNDTIGMKIDLDPCNPNGSTMSIDVTERNHGIDYPIERVTAGEEKDYPIPGLSIVVPGLGHVGVDVAVYIAGTPSALILKAGLNACAALAAKTVCASKIPGLDTILPWYVLQGTYSFGDICEPEKEMDVELLKELEEELEEFEYEDDDMALEEELEEVNSWLEDSNDDEEDDWVMVDEKEQQQKAAMERIAASVAVA